MAVPRDHNWRRRTGVVSPRDPAPIKYHPPSKRLPSSFVSSLRFPTMGFPKPITPAPSMTTPLDIMNEPNHPATTTISTVTIGFEDSGTQAGSRDSGTLVGSTDLTTPLGSRDSGTLVGSTDLTTPLGSNDSGTLAGSNDLEIPVESHDPTTPVRPKDPTTPVGSNDTGWPTPTHPFDGTTTTQTSPKLQPYVHETRLTGNVHPKLKKPKYLSTYATKSVGSQSSSIAELEDPESFDQHFSRGVTEKPENSELLGSSEAPIIGRPYKMALGTESEELLGLISLDEQFETPENSTTFESISYNSSPAADLNYDTTEAIPERTNSEMAKYLHPRRLMNDYSKERQNVRISTPTGGGRNEFLTSIEPPRGEHNQQKNFQTFDLKGQNNQEEMFSTVKEQMNDPSGVPTRSGITQDSSFDQGPKLRTTPILSHGNTFSDLPIHTPPNVMFGHTVTPNINSKTDQISTENNEPSTTTATTKHDLPTLSMTSTSGSAMHSTIRETATDFKDDNEIIASPISPHSNSTLGAAIFDWSLSRFKHIHKPELESNVGLKQPPYAEDSDPRNAKFTKSKSAVDDSSLLNSRDGLQRSGNIVDSSSNRKNERLSNNRSPPRILVAGNAREISNEVAGNNFEVRREEDKTLLNSASQKNRTLTITADEDTMNDAPVLIEAYPDAKKHFFLAAMNERGELRHNLERKPDAAENEVSFSAFHDSDRSAVRTRSESNEDKLKLGETTDNNVKFETSTDPTTGLRVNSMDVMFSTVSSTPTVMDAGLGVKIDNPESPCFDNPCGPRASCHPITNGEKTQAEMPEEIDQKMDQHASVVEGAQRKQGNEEPHLSLNLETGSLKQESQKPPAHLTRENRSLRKTSKGKRAASLLRFSDTPQPNTKLQKSMPKTTKSGSNESTKIVKTGSTKPSKTTRNGSQEISNNPTKVDPPGEKAVTKPRPFVCLCHDKTVVAPNQSCAVVPVNITPPAVPFQRPVEDAGTPTTQLVAVAGVAAVVLAVLVVLVVMVWRSKRYFTQLSKRKVYGQQLRLQHATKTFVQTFASNPNYYTPAQAYPPAPPQACPPEMFETDLGSPPEPPTPPLGLCEPPTPPPQDAPHDGAGLPPVPQLRGSDLRLVGELGEGCFGRVYRGLLRTRKPSTKEAYAKLTNFSTGVPSLTSCHMKVTDLATCGNPSARPTAVANCTTMEVAKRSQSDYMNENFQNFPENDDYMNDTPHILTEIDNYMNENLQTLMEGDNYDFEDQVVAVKVLKETNGAAEESLRDDFMREAKMMSAFNHKNIVRLLGIVILDSPKTPWMVFEYMALGDLATLLRSKAPPLMMNFRSFKKFSSVRNKNNSCGLPEAELGTPNGGDNQAGEVRQLPVGENRDSLGGNVGTDDTFDRSDRDHNGFDQRDRDHNGFDQRDRDHNGFDQNDEAHGRFDKGYGSQDGFAERDGNHTGFDQNGGNQNTQNHSTAGNANVTSELTIASPPGDWTRQRNASATDGTTEVRWRRDGNDLSFDGEDGVVFCLDQRTLVAMARDVASGMAYLSRQHFVHRDLATRNCLVSADVSVKIADFGLSRDVYTSDYYKVGGVRLLPVRWMAPESLLYGRFTAESDVWSYGVLLWELYTYAMQPYYGCSNEQVLKLILQGVHLHPVSSCPPPVREVMRRCWASAPAERPSFEAIEDTLRAIEQSYDLEAFESSLEGRDYREEVIAFNYDLENDYTNQRLGLDGTLDTTASTLKRYPESVATQLSRLTPYENLSLCEDPPFGIHESPYSQSEFQPGNHDLESLEYAFPKIPSSTMSEIRATNSSVEVESVKPKDVQNKHFYANMSVEEDLTTEINSINPSSIGQYTGYKSANVDTGFCNVP